MEDKLVKIAIGLALENAIYNGQEIRRLTSLYSDPDMERALKLHDQLISSNDHLVRETAFFLQLGLDIGPLQGDPLGLVGEMREMEHLLYAYLNKYGRAQKAMNDWLNYVVNASQSIIDGYWMDAKVLLSLAVQTSKDPTVEALKTNPELRYRVETLQGATASYFQELKGYPLKLMMSDESVEAILMIQEPLLEMLQSPNIVEEKSEDEYAIKVVRGFHTAIKYLMEKKESEAKRELLNVERLLENWLENLGDEENRRQLDDYHENVKSVIGALT